MAVIKCKNCENYRICACYYGPKVLVRIFGPMIVPANAWCNRFNEKMR